MPHIPFDQIPDSGRLWVFGVNRPLSEDEESTVLERVDAFLATWAAHGTPLTVARDWRFGRFLHVALDEASVPPSGCSIDAMVNTLKSLESDLGIVFVDNMPVWYRAEDGVVRATRAEFKAKAASGEVTSETMVFDNTVTRVGQARDGEWERPAAEGWHGRAFFKEGTAV